MPTFDTYYFRHTYLPGLGFGECTILLFSHHVFSLKYARCSEETWKTFGHDYWSYGIGSNRPALEAVAQYVVDQGLAPRVVSPEELFLETEP